LVKGNNKDYKTLILIVYHKCQVNILVRNYHKMWKEICNLVVHIKNLCINLEIVVEIVEFLSHVVAVFPIHINKLIKVMSVFINVLVDMLRLWVLVYNISIHLLIEFMLLIWKQILSIFKNKKHLQKTIFKSLSMQLFIIMLKLQEKLFIQFKILIDLFES